MQDQIIHHKHPLDVRTLPNKQVGVCLVNGTLIDDKVVGDVYSVVVSSFDDTPENRTKCVRFVDKHHNNLTTIRGLLKVYGK